MKSIMGFLMLLFSATIALANDYQIIPGTYSGISGKPNADIYTALVVDVTSGPIYLCTGNLDVQPTAVSVRCEKVNLNGATMPSGPAVLSPLGAGAFGAGASGVDHPGIWKAWDGIVTFCSSNGFGLQPNLYCATTPLPQ